MLEAVFLLGQIGVVMAFAVIVVYSKHLHIALAPLNVMFSRRPNALGPLEPMRVNGKVLDFEEADPDTDVFGLGKIEDFTWKGLLDMATCTECGRCQSQCPAWATGKPLSPKQVILDLRDHAFAKAPYLLAPPTRSARRCPTRSRPRRRRPLVGAKDDDGVIDPDVLWSCTNCGACVEECPVDIEHIDHIDGMRRHQVLIESAFPVEAAGMLKNLENKGDPWGMGADRRGDWIGELDFEVPVVDGEDRPDDIEYLFWVGCAGALEDRAKKTTKAIADAAAHRRGEVRGARPGRDLHRRPGPPDRQRVRLLDAGPAEHRDPQRAAGRRRRSWRPARTASTPSRSEYPQLGGNYEVIHHTQLLARLVEDGKLTPAGPRSRRRSPTTTRASWAGTTRSTPRPGRSSTRCRAQRRGDAPVQGPRVLLRRGRRADVDGGADRQADQHRADRRGPRRWTRTPSPPPARTAWSCSATPSAPRRASGDAKETLEVIDVAQLLVRSSTLARVAVADDAGPAPVSDAETGAGTGQVGPGH